MDLVKLKNQRLANFIDSKIVPFTPSSIIPQIFFSILTVYSFYLLKLFHKLQINGFDSACFSKIGIAQIRSFWKLYINRYQKVGKQLDIQELTPSWAQIKHELVEYFLIDLYSQQFKGIMSAHSCQDTQKLFSVGKGLNVYRIKLLLEQSAEVLGCYLLTVACGHHSFVW